MNFNAIGQWFKSRRPVSVSDLEETEGRIIAALKTESAKIMVPQSEIAAALKAANDKMLAIGNGIDGIATEVTTIGNETAKSLEQIKELTDAINSGGNASQDVVDALAALQATTDSLSNRTSALATQVKSVDDLVPDAVA